MLFWLGLLASLLAAMIAGLPQLPIVPLFQSVCWTRKNCKLPLLLILPLFKDICENKKRGKPKFPMLTKVTNVTIITIIPGCLWEQNKENTMFQMLPLLPLFQGVCLKREQNESYKCYYYYYYSRLFVATAQRKNKVLNVTIVTFVPGCSL